MKKPENKILLFPQPKEPTAQTVVCQIGSERFALHIEVEDLPPLAAVIELKPTGRKGKTRVVRGVRSGFNQGSCEQP
jgi:hypothetical protein